MPRFARSAAAALPLALLVAACGGGVQGPASWSGGQGRTAPSGAEAPARPSETPSSTGLTPDLLARLDAARVAAAPDRRTARFDVAARDSLGQVFLVGETTEPEALARLVAAWPGAVVNRVRVLPDTARLGPLRLGLVSVSVANLRTEPRESAELASQALLGTPLRILDRRGGWALVQTPDRYLGWMDAATFEAVDRAALARHRAADKLVVTALFSWVYAAPDDRAAPVSDLVAGSLLELGTGAFRADTLSADTSGTSVVYSDASMTHLPVRLPDGRQGWVRRADAQFFEAWAARGRATGPHLVASARAMTGLPYLWGGTSAKGMDCSGFTRTVFLMNGLLLPRDASQQVRAGVTVDSTGDWSQLRPGDLLFFGRKAQGEQPERVVHVGMWIGDGRYIHSSGRVQVQSLDDPARADYNAYDRGRYLRTKRISESDPWTLLLRTGRLYDAALR